MSLLDDLTELRNEAKGGDDEITELAFNTARVLLEQVVAAQMPAPSLCAFCGGITAEWLITDYSGPHMRLQCETDGRAYIYFRGADRQSGIEPPSNLLDRLKWLTSAVSGERVSDQTTED